jgi:GNAT superfamily N-acetyltransferase
VRFAGAGDAAAIGAIHVDAWRAAYAGIVPDTTLASLSKAERAARWRRAIESDPRQVQVAEAGGRILGWSAAGPCRNPDGGFWGEIYAVYVDPRAWRQGAGRAVVAAAGAELSERGYRRLTLWVLERNAAARAFYGRQAFEPDGGRKVITVGGAALLELRLARELPAAG